MEAAAYVDPNTIRRKGDVVKMWNSFDYNTAPSDLRGSYLSKKRKRTSTVQKRELECSRLSSSVGCIRLLGWIDFKPLESLFWTLKGLDIHPSI